MMNKYKLLQRKKKKKMNRRNGAILHADREDLIFRMSKIPEAWTAAQIMLSLQFAKFALCAQALKCSELFALWTLRPTACLPIS